MPNKQDPQSRKWGLVINNPTEHGIDHGRIKEVLAQLKIVYWCLADEIGLDTKTPHTHVFFVVRSSIRFSRIKRLFPYAHIEAAHGSAKENREYITKSGKWENDPKSDTRVDGSFEESGTLPEEPGQGARTDIATVYEMIADGQSNAEIMAANPNFAAQISRMDKIRQDILEERYRTTFRQLDVTYIFGPTATGKTRGVMEKYGYKGVYRVTDYAHPFDRYAQEEVLALDEFRSSLLIGDMLDYLDGYPLPLPARYANRQACYEIVYIISNIDLRDQYPNVQQSEPATWKAFLRRISHVIEYRSTGPPIDHGKALDYIFPPPPPLPDWVTEIDAEQTEIGDMPF